MSRKASRKNMMFGWIFGAKMEALISKNKHFALYLLQFKKFRLITKFIKIVPRNHAKATKIGASGAQGPFLL